MCYRLAVNRSPATEGIAEDSSVTWVNLDDPEGMQSELKRAFRIQKETAARSSRALNFNKPSTMGRIIEQGS